MADIAQPVADRPPRDNAENVLGDFTTTRAILPLVPLAVVIGVLGAGISLALLDMIGFFTNLFYFQRLSVHLVSPYGNTLGAIAVVIPIGGGLVVGLMARFGSEQIRGHGIPEAMERILINGSKVQPRLAILKPISSAISIGTGGPFGAEGPIILTGGAVGSVVGQLFHLTAAQRKSLLVAGAAAGMSAVFGTPVAATLFGVELLAFEFKPRSMVLIGIAAATADGLRMVMASAGLVAPQPIFPVPSHPPLGGVVLLGAMAVGVACGFAAWLMTQAVYRSEDLFKKLTGHLDWMWWPMIGGLIIGLGGLVDSRALGVGYDTIHAELLGELGVSALAVLFVVKLVIWSGALGSGTSGGILAPILMMGAALGGVLGHVLPGASPGVWALIGMAGALAGVTRSPFTAIIFAFELTHDANSLLALLVVATVSHLVSVLVLKRSILTEKVARRGFHVMREYSVDPLEATFVREVMDTDVFTVEPDRPLSDLYGALGEGSPERRQRLYPVLGSGGELVGILPWSAVLAARANWPKRLRGDARTEGHRLPRRDTPNGRRSHGCARYRRDSRGRADRCEASPWSHHPVRPAPGPPEAPRRGAARRASAHTATCRSADSGRIRRRRRVRSRLNYMATVRHALVLCSSPILPAQPSLASFGLACARALGDRLARLNWCSERSPRTPSTKRTNGWRISRVVTASTSAIARRSSCASGYWIPKGADAHIGTPLDCPLCDRAEMPDGLRLIRTSVKWDERTMPKGLSRAHRIAAGTWGRIVVHDGHLRFAARTEPELKTVLSGGSTQAIPPEVEHEIEPLAEVRFSIDFFSIAEERWGSQQSDVAWAGLRERWRDGLLGPPSLPRMWSRPRWRTARNRVRSAIGIESIKRRPSLFTDSDISGRRG